MSPLFYRIPVLLAGEGINLTLFYRRINRLLGRSKDGEGVNMTMFIGEPTDCWGGGCMGGIHGFSSSDSRRS
jgi:hypothetical protein